MPDPKWRKVTTGTVGQDLEWGIRTKIVRALSVEPGALKIGLVAVYDLVWSWVTEIAGNLCWIWGRTRKWKLDWSNKGVRG
jgi:hypothetical protein